MLLLQQAHPARNALVLANAGDWELMQERAQASPGVPAGATSQQQEQGVAGGMTGWSRVGDVGGRLDWCVLGASDPAAVTAAWANQLALRGEDGLCLDATLAFADEVLSVGVFGREPLNGSYTADAGVAQAAAEALLQQHLQQALGQLPDDAADAAVGQLSTSSSSGGAPGSFGGGSSALQQYPRHRLSSLANALLLAGPGPFCLGGGAAAAADRLAVLGSMCRAESFRQGTMVVAGRASRRAAVFEHYLSRRLHNLANQPQLLHVLGELVTGHAVV